jgi:hypothetical protein
VSSQKGPLGPEEFSKKSLDGTKYKRYKKKLSFTQQALIISD